MEESTEKMLTSDQHTQEKTVGQTEIATETLPKPITQSEVGEIVSSEAYKDLLWKLHEGTLNTSDESEFSICRNIKSGKTRTTEVNRGHERGVGESRPFGSDPLSNSQPSAEDEYEILHTHSHPDKFWFRPSRGDTDSDFEMSMHNWVKTYKLRGVSTAQLRAGKLKQLYPDMRFDLPAKIPNGGGKIEREYRLFSAIVQPVSNNRCQILIYRHDPDLEDKGTDEALFDRKFGRPRDISQDPKTSKKIVEFLNKAGYSVGILFLEKDEKGDLKLSKFPGSNLLFLNSDSPSQ